MKASELAIATAHGPTEVLAGAAFLTLAYLTWRYSEAFTAMIVGEHRAARMAKRRFANKIGGTIFLAIIGAVALVEGIVESLR
jgi:hypothetical protein